MEIDALRSAMQSRLRDAVAGSGLELTCSALIEGTPPMDTPAASEIVRSTEELTGYEATSAAFGTEGPYFNQMGISTVILGPGDIDQAHQPDEYLAADRIVPGIDLLRKLIRRFCVEPAN
jgi:acetylornithine deacetylase